MVDMVQNAGKARAWSVFLLASFLFSFSPSNASSEPAAPARSKLFPRIIAGQRVAAQVPVVQVRRAETDGSTLCTGTLLSSSSVLTAWHCVAKRPASMRVVIDGQRVAVKRIFVHPKAKIDEETGLIYNDVAILQLKKRVGGKQPAPLLVSRVVQPDDAVTIWGYGLDERGVSGNLLKGISIIDGISRDFLSTVFGEDESNPCSGDSGGPATFTYTDEDGATKTGLVGITSAGTNTDCSVGDETFFINLQSESVLSFIASHVGSLRIL